MKDYRDLNLLLFSIDDYYLEHHKYPSSLETLIPKYLSKMLVVPQPADGICNTDNNEYRYTLYQDDYFELRFFGREYVVRL